MKLANGIPTYFQAAMLCFYISHNEHEGAQDENIDNCISENGESIIYSFLSLCCLMGV